MAKKKNTIPMKQVTVMVEIALTLEVPITMDSDQISDFIKRDTSWEVTSHNRKINMVETSDILDVSDILGSNGGIEVVNIVEAPIG